MKSSQRQRIQIFVLIAVLFSLLGYALWQQTPRYERDSTSSAPANTTDEDILSELPENAGVIQRIFNWGVEDVQSLQIEAVRDESTMTLVRTSAGWTLAEANRIIDQDVAENIVTTTAILPYAQTISETDVTSYDTYGLTVDTLQILVKIILETGEQHAVAVGYPTADEHGFYAIIDDRDGIYVIPREPINFLAVYLRETVAAG